MPDFWHYELQGESMKKRDLSPDKASVRTVCLRRPVAQPVR